MPVLNIEGHQVTVGDEFLKLSPDQQNATVDEIAKSLGTGQPQPEAQNDPELAAMKPSDMIRQSEVDRRAAGLTEGKMGAVNAAAGGVGRGISLGLGDRALAALTAVPSAIGNAIHGQGFDPGTEYGLNRDALFKARDLQTAAHPVAATAGEVAGGLASGIATMGLAAPAAGAGLGARVASGIGQGAVAGGLYGGGQAAEGDVLSGAGSGALLGGALGGALPVAGAALGTVGRAADNALSPYLRPEQFAAKKVAQRIAQGGQTVEQVSRRVAANPDMTVADVGGDGVRNLLRTSVNIPNRAQGSTVTRLNLRNVAAPERIDNAIEATLGDPQVYRQHLDQTLATQQNEAAPLFEAARRSGARVDISPVIARIDNTIGNPNGYRNAGITPDSVTGTLQRVRRMLGANPRGTAHLEDIGQLHNVRQDLDQMIATNLGTPLGRQLTQVRQVLTRQMEAASPEFRRANAIYAGEAQSRNALEAGLQYGMGKGDIDQQAIRAMSPAERSMFRMGVARGMHETLQKGVDGADFVRRLYGSAAKRNRINAAFDNSADRRAFASVMFREAKKAKTRQTVIGNSTTAKQLADQADAGIDAASMAGTAVSAATGHFLPAVTALLSRFGSRLGGVTPEVAAQISRMTTSRNPAEIRQILQLIRNSESRQRGISNGMSAARRIGTTAASEQAAATTR